MKTDSSHAGGKSDRDARDARDARDSSPQRKEASVEHRRKMDMLRAQYGDASSKTKASDSKRDREAPALKPQMVDNAEVIRLGH